MQRKPILLNPDEIPQVFHPFLATTAYDTSCSPQARVYYLESNNGLFLKRSAKGTLAQEAAMTRYFHQKGWAAEVLAYESLEEDWLLTARVPGEDLTHREYLSDPYRLCDTLAEILCALHNLPYDDCPLQNKNEIYLKTAEINYRNGMFDPSYSYADPTIEQAWDHVCRHRHLLQKESLLHGDFCLPNLLLKNWHFSGLIDLGNAGVGDRHIDLFWGAWSLQYNLKSNAYQDRFFDAYGRETIDFEKLKLIEMIECFG
ncbi:MAG: aminoglycoside 3'-phosphotransferase [Clostridia bacterium]|nr:aminoglycoside 3'-phosphotransferase [Clostridia bacterium]